IKRDMEIPKDKETRIGDLPRELRDIIQTYRVIPEITLKPDMEEIYDLMPSYSFIIKFPDKTIVDLSVEFEREDASDYLLKLQGGNHRVKLGRVDFIKGSQKLKITRDRKLALSGHSFMSLSHEALEILMN